MAAGLAAEAPAGAAPERRRLVAGEAGRLEGAGSTTTAATAKAMATPATTRALPLHTRAATWRTAWAALVGCSPWRPAFRWCPCSFPAARCVVQVAHSACQLCSVAFGLLGCRCVFVWGRHCAESCCALVGGLCVVDGRRWRRGQQLRRRRACEGGRWRRGQQLRRRWAYEGGRRRICRRRQGIWHIWKRCSTAWQGTCRLWR
jgi:hypothetical protein